MCVPTVPGQAHIKRETAVALLRAPVSERARGQKTGGYTVGRHKGEKGKKDRNAWLTMHNCPSVSVTLPGSFYPWTTHFISFHFFPISLNESLSKGGLSPEFMN